VRLVVEQPARTLTIESRARVRVDRPIPMPAPSDPELAEIAEWARASRDASPAGPAAYLFPSPLIPLDREIAAWCAGARSRRGVLDAALALALRIQREFAFDPTATLVDTAPGEAFRKRGGVCQDFAQIMISGLRAAGLSRGLCLGLYPHLAAAGPAPARRRRCDACLGAVWAGPQLGWVGVDPTNGIWMAGDHIVVAIGRDYADVAPIDGIVLGWGAQECTSRSMSSRWNRSPPEPGLRKVHARADVRGRKAPVRGARHW
jgi:transglutaminase-like putative cysteine protease